MKFKNTLELVLVSLLILAVLLPLGILGSVHSIGFIILFFIHLALLCFSSSVAIMNLCSLYKSNKLALKLLLLLSLALSIFSIVPSIIMPITARDALIHHLAIPKLWITNGSIYSTPWHEWSFYPMLIQLAFTALLQLGPEQLCSIYILLFLPLVLLVAVKITEEISDDDQAPTLAVIVLLLTPIILKLSSLPLVDFPLVFLCGSGVYYLLKLQENIAIKKYSFLAGLAWGLALSCKLNALPAFAITIIIFLITSLGIHKQKIKSDIFKAYFLVSIIALVCFSPWLIKNWLWASNPMYPYLSSIFGQHLPKFDSGLSGLNPLQQRLMLYGESALEVIFLPIRIFIEGQDDNPRLFDGKLTVLMLFGLGFGLFNFKNYKYRQLSLISLVFILFALLSTATRVRYLAPTFIILAVLSGSGLAKLTKLHKLNYSIVSILLFLQFTYSAMYLAKGSESLNAIKYSLGSLSKAQYLEQKIPEYPLIEFCNTKLPKDARISLIYTGNQFYLYEPQVYSAGHTSADQILSWLRHSESLSELVLKIKEYGLTHFVIQDSRLQAIMQTALSEHQKNIWNALRINNFVPLFSANGFTLYAIQ